MKNQWGWKTRRDQGLLDTRLAYMVKTIVTALESGD